MARLSVSALVFDYILTGPISVVSAGQYLGRLLNEIARDWRTSDLRVSTRTCSPPVFGVLVTVYFWWSNIKGVHESSGKALRIMQITTVMVVVFLIWCPITLLLAGERAAAARCPMPANLQFSERRAWAGSTGTFWPQISVVAIIIAFGHSLLSMSGFETLAQVYREIAYPKLKNLRITGNIVCIYAVVCTGVITLFAGMIIPDAMRGKYVDNLLGGLAMHLAGPVAAAAGLPHLRGDRGRADSVRRGEHVDHRRQRRDEPAWPRMACCCDWFRKPHKRFGTTYRIINLIALLQIATIFAEPRRRLPARRGLRVRRGVELLPEGAGRAGAALPAPRPGIQDARSICTSAGCEIPIGLVVTTLILFLVAIANLFSKQIATIYGVAFTIVLFVMFTISEQVNKRARRLRTRSGLEQFNLDHQPEITAETVHARPGCVLVAVRDYQPHGAPAQACCEKTNLRRHDIVVMTVRPISTGAGEYELSDEQLFTDYEQELFTRVVTMAEKEGKTVELLVVPGVDPFDAMVQTAAKLQASRLVTGVSAAHGFRGTGAPHRPGLGEAARAAPSVLARNHHARTGRRCT